MAEVPRSKLISYSSLVITLLIWCIMMLYQSCSSKQEDDPGFTEPQSIIRSNYLGDQSCANCHESEYDLWKNSHHFHSMEPANEQTVLGDFNNAEFEHYGVTSRFFKRGKEYFVSTEGPDGNPQEYKIEYTFGYEPLQQYLVSFPGGRMQTLHLCWDTEEEKWFNLFPQEDFENKDWMHWTKGSMTWNSMCAECHSTDLDKNYFSEADTFNTTWSVINVSCESCHGPGRDHVEWASSGKEYPIEKIKEHLFSTTGTPAKIQVEECAPCHSRRSELTLEYRNGEKFLDHYIPQTLVEPLYHADGQILDEVYVYGSFLQSNMYKNGVKCTDCHDAHSLELISIGNELCGKCHEPAKFDVVEHHFHAVNTEGSQCINCHMTGKNYMVNDFRRDHSFRIPRPDQTVTFGTPNACNGCHTDKSPEWASKVIEKQFGKERKYHFSDDLIYGARLDSSSARRLVKLIKDQSQPAIARATAIDYLRAIPDPVSLPAITDALEDNDPLVRVSALEAIAQLPADMRKQLASNLLNDEIRAVRISAANILADIPAEQFTPGGREVKTKAEKEFEETLQAQADLPAGRSQAGQYYSRKGMLKKAEKEYQMAINMDPFFTPARENLALLYNGTGRNPKAMEQYREILNYEPNNGRIYYYMGLLFAEDQVYDRSIEALNKAKELSPDYVRVYYNLGLVYQTVQKRPEAETTYLEGLERFPEAAELHYAIAIFYLQGNQPDQAASHIQFLKETDPENPAYQQLFNL